MVDRITVYPEGGKAVTLTGNDHLATGGEGSVYAKGGLVYKIYLDPTKAIRAGMERKLAVLTSLQHPGIAAPRAALRNKAGEFIGLVLPQVPGEALCRAFTSTWRDPNQFGLAQTAVVTDAMRDITNFAHAHDALMVDANEMNWLLHGTAPVAIDVDSWQLPGFPATAIMPSIRDHSRPGFSRETDWFAWGVVTFNLWTGVHPYKGNHPRFKMGAMQERMKAFASVFDAGVRLPGAARPIADIPLPLRNWYERTFQTAERTPPPSANASAIGAQTAPRVKVRQTLAGSLRMERLGNAGGQVVAAFNGFVVATADKNLLLWDAVARKDIPQVRPAELQAVLRRSAALVRTDFGRVLLVLDAAAGMVRAQLIETGATAQLACQGDTFWQSGDRVFALVPGVSNGLVELSVASLGSKLILSVAQQWPVAALSTQFLRGVFLQDCLGSPFVGVLEGQGVVQASAKQLRGYRVSEGFAADSQNVWLAGIRLADGETVRLQLSFKAGKFEIVREEIAPDTSLDGAANAAGVAVLRDGAGLLVAKGAVQKRLDNAGLSDDLRLFSLGAGGIGGFEDSEVVRLSLS